MLFSSHGWSLLLKYRYFFLCVAMMVLHFFFFNIWDPKPGATWTALCMWCVFLLHSAIYDVVEEKVDSEPDFQYIPEKSPQDPAQLDQHALRDSMATLKEGLISGAILAQFDVRRKTQICTHLLLEARHQAHCLHQCILIQQSWTIYVQFMLWFSRLIILDNVDCNAVELDGIKPWSVSLVNPDHWLQWGCQIIEMCLYNTIALQVTTQLNQQLFE